MQRSKNITLNLRNITGHFTGKAKITTLILIIIMLSFANITFTSALSYQSNVGVGFTFNPTLSVSISPSDLVISNLVPGNTLDSNVINVSVATNSAYGYILTTSVGNNATYNTTNLVHTNGSSVFSSISTNASLTSLEDISDNNIWGYSYKLSGDNTWSNYSGLPLYNSPLKVLINTDSNTETGPNSLDFKIAAKASIAQPSGVYSNVINFSAVIKPTPTTLAEAYANYYQATNKTMHNGYYVMQDMADSHICENTEVIGSELQVIDIRDDKVYWIAKLADGHCWMTQNLDLDLSQEVALTSETSDINPNTYNTNIYTETTGYSKDNMTGIVSWLPEKSTIAYNELDNTTWLDDILHPFSYNRLDLSDGSQIYPDTNVTNNHGVAGNYYNWTATLASNNSTNATTNPGNSICPKGWRLPNATNKEFGNLLATYNIIATNTSTSYIENMSSVNSVGAAPLYLIRSGSINGGSLYNSGSYGYYWSNTFYYSSYTYNFYFGSSLIRPQGDGNRGIGRSIRCLTR